MNIQQTQKGFFFLRTVTTLMQERELWNMYDNASNNIRMNLRMN